MVEIVAYPEVAELPFYPDPFRDDSKVHEVPSGRPADGML